MFKHNAEGDTAPHAPDCFPNILSSITVMFAVTVELWVMVTWPLWPLPHFPLVSFFRPKTPPRMEQQAAVLPLWEDGAFT